MVFIIDDLIIAGVVAACAGGYAGLVRSSKNMERDGGGGAAPTYTPPPSYAPPPSYSPEPSYPQYDTPQYGGEQSYYQDQGGGYYSDGYTQGYPAQNEVTLNKHGGHFYANVGYGDNAMNMLVDTGASSCVVGDEIWRWLKSQGIRSTGRGSASLAGGRVASTERFTFPYLTVIGSDNQSFVTVENVEAQYLPGTSNLLGMSFLGQCHVTSHGNQMTIRG